MRVWLAVVGIFVVLCASARADVYDDKPAAVSLGPGNVWLFARGADGTVLARHLSAGVWSDWAAVPGVEAGSGPAALVYGNTIMLFVRGADAAIWQNTFQNGNWVGWISLGGGLTSAPSVGMRIGTTTADLVARGTDNALWHRAFTPGPGWAPWEQIPGSANVTSAPTVTGFTSSGTIDVFVRDAAGGLMGFYADAGGWHSQPASFGGVMDGAPTSTAPVRDWLDIYARGSNDLLYRYHHPGGPWQFADATKLDSPPAVTSDAPNHEYLFAKVGNDLQVMAVDGAATGSPVYRGWNSLGPIALPAPPPAAPAPPVIVTPTPLVTLAPVLSYNYKVTRRSTRLSALRVRSIPAGSTVAVSCPRGCSARRWTKHNAHGTLSLSRFTRHVLKVGTKITVTVSKPGAITSVKTLKIRSHKPPSVTTRCLPPGAKTPQHC